MAQSPSDVYARQLFPKKCGIPLFIPEPYDNLTREYHDQGTSVGDVGIVTPDGSFSFVFNICVPANHPVNCYGVPDGFSQVSLTPGEISYLSNIHPPGSDISSASVHKTTLDVENALKENEFAGTPAGVSVGYSFSSTPSEAAILTLPEGAARQDLLNLNKFRRHAAENALHWYEFVNGTLGRGAPNGSLYLVTGCDKSTTWGIASVTRASGSNSLSLKFTAARVVEAGAAYTYSWEKHCPATVRIGPTPSSDNSERLQNQCIFLRGFKLTLREDPMAVLKGNIRIFSTSNAKPGNILGGRSSYIPFMDGGQRSWSGKGLEHTSLGSGQQNIQASLCPPETEAKNKEDVSSDGDILLEAVPRVAEVYHPSTAINNYILACAPDAIVAVTHESDWWVLSYDDNVLPSDDVLLGRLSHHYQLSMESGCVSLIPRDMERFSRYPSTSVTSSSPTQPQLRFFGPSSQNCVSEYSNTSANPYDDRPTSFVNPQTNSAFHTIFASDASSTSRYLQIQNSSLKHSPHSGTQPFLFTQSHGTHGTLQSSSYEPSPSQNESAVRGLAAQRESEQPSIPLERPIPCRPFARDNVSGAHPYHSTQRANNSMALGVSHRYPAPSSSRRHASPTFPPIPNQMNDLLLEFRRESFTFSDPSTSTFPASPPSDSSSDRAALQPTINTNRMQSEFNEVDGDPLNRSALYTVSEFNDEFRHWTANENVGIVPLAPHSAPPTHDQRGRWSRSPSVSSVSDRGYPSRSTSSQSCASYSTSKSDSYPKYSSFPNGTRLPSNSASTSSAAGASRKNKMHQCSICNKRFPRPSGLATHMNSHTGAKPYKCSAPDCDKSFAVRSNAKRHFKTHGLAPSSPDPPAPVSSFTVDFETPQITHASDSREALPKLKWVPADSTPQTTLDDGHHSLSGSGERDSGPLPPTLPSVYPPGSSFNARDRRDSMHPFPTKPW